MVTGMRGVRAVEGLVLVRPTLLSEVEGVGLTAVGQGELRRRYNTTLGLLRESGEGSPP
jgi:hypothetical protein